ncbi:MAG: aminopeptidase, partial [Ruminococcus sp.]|nr:aminopeptidase [Ruminococcus sp.]
MSEEKTKTEQLRERIMLSENKGVKSLAAEEIARADEFCEGYKSFLNASPVEREAVAEALEQAKAKGFAEYDPEAEYKAGDKVYLVNRGKAIALAVIGKNGVKN